jgi:hypothetical protein
MTQYIHGSCGFSSNRGTPTILYEDNIACIAQLKGGCIKEDGTKHISPKFVLHMTLISVVMVMFSEFTRKII